jgi:hypothetical protein
LAADLDKQDFLDGDGTDDEDGWDLSVVLEFDMPPSKMLSFDVTLFRPPSFMAPPDVKFGRGAGPQWEEVLACSLILEMMLCKHDGTLYIDDNGHQ